MVLSLPWVPQARLPCPSIIHPIFPGMQEMDGPATATTMALGQPHGLTGHALGAAPKAVSTPK